jgi:RNA recognition motif-containing protein
MATKRLYVGNIPYSATDDSLREAFGAYSPTDVKIIEGRGFAFVEIDADHLDTAVTEMNGKMMEGRTLNVNEARPRENAGGGGGSRGNYSGGGGGRSGGGGGRSSGGSRW